MRNESTRIDKYFRPSAFPTMWCPGCGVGTILQSLTRGIDAMGWDQDEIVYVSGIGCSARAPSYLDFHGVQTTHGRALSVAAGIKLANPKLKVVVVIGDGDAAAIGGNHLLHSSRRNIDLTLIVINNMIYGMTGGQISPTSKLGTFSTTSPYGSYEPPLDICRVAEAAGATYVARTSVAHYAKMDEYFRKGLAHKGFSVIEVMSPCHTNFGRRNQFRSNADILRYFQKNCVEVSDEKAKSLPPEKIRIGEFVERDFQEFTEAYYRVAASAAQSGKQVQEEAQSFPAGTISRRTDVRLSGLGGYGLVLSGVMFAEAAVASRVNATQVTSYGPEARGGVSRTDMVLAPWSDEIFYPEVVQNDIVFALTQESLEKYGPQATELLVYDSRLDAGAIQFREGTTALSLPILETALQTGGTAVAVGTVCLGILLRYLECFPIESLEAVMKTRFKPAVLEKNRAALCAGCDLMQFRREEKG